jgi:hypothetical protein
VDANAPIVRDVTALYVIDASPVVESAYASAGNGPIIFSTPAAIATALSATALPHASVCGVTTVTVIDPPDPFLTCRNVSFVGVNASPPPVADAYAGTTPARVML